jgi:hypothetical protein
MGNNWLAVYLYQVEVPLVVELFQEGGVYPSHTPNVVFFGTSSRWKGDNWLRVYLCQVEVPLVGELFQESEDLPQPYTKCCVFWD